MRSSLIFFIFVAITGCYSPPVVQVQAMAAINDECPEENNITFDTSASSIHIYVALCDNQYQGIVPVPAKIGNGQDPDHNLYWGCGFGIRTYFKNSKIWKLLKTQSLDSVKMERLVFKHTTQNYYLIADAYNGKYIQQCTMDFLKSSAGQMKDTIQLQEKTIGIAGNAQLIAYIGHDGLMDFQLPGTYENSDDIQRDVVILACYSKKYFSPYLKKANVNPLVWTSGLMCPEAYTIHDAITGYVMGEPPEKVRGRAISAYAQYQKCSKKAAGNLLLTGW